ncbi:hypothetical protein ACWCL1_08090 [Ligilactobacillus sp. LYQ135]
MFKKRKNKDEKIKLTREQKKQLKQRKKRLDKKRNNFKGQEGFLSKYGYVEYEGYIHVLDKEKRATEVERNKDGYYLAAYDVLIQYGTHNPAKIGWLTELIPSIPIEDGNVFFALREKKMSKNTENDVLGKQLHSKIVTMENSKDEKDERLNSKRDMQILDAHLARQLAGMEKSIIDSDLTLFVKSPTVEKLKLTMQKLNQNYLDNSIKGIMLVRKTGQQLATLVDLFHDTSSDAWHNSDMSTVDAGRLFLPSSGFSDKYGVNVGEDVYSYLAGTPSIIDFSGIRNAIIHTGHITGIASCDGMEGSVLLPNGTYGSAIAHVIAESNYLYHGTRTHYINLVDFAYYFPDSQIFDMSRHSINALETYGSKETVAEDANNNFNKVTEIVMMLLEDEKTDPAIKALFRERLVDWIINRANGNGMYTTDPYNDPTKAWQILANSNHENYPTLQDFITELQSLVQESEQQGERAREKAQMVLNAVKTASRMHPSLFSEATDIPDKLDATDRNIYYDLSHISDNPTIKGATFLNVIAYVVNRAQMGDMIVVNGLDQININPKVLTKYRDKMDLKGIGLIATFEDSNNEQMNFRTLEGFVKPLSVQDMVILGGLDEQVLPRIKESWHRELPERVQKELLKNEDNNFYFYRKSDYQNAIIDMHLIL